MLKIFEKNIHAVRIRCSINLLLRYAGQILILAGVIAIIAVMIEKLLALEVINANTLIGFLLFVTAAILAIWFYKQPSKLQISLLLDERLGLKERFSTALKICDKHDAFAEAAYKEALDKAQNLNLQGHFPIKLSKGWVYTSTLWLIVALLFAFMPEKDLLGIQSKKDNDILLAKQQEDAEAKIKEQTEAVKIAMKKINDPNIAEAIGKLDQLPAGAKPEEVQRNAIRNLTDLSEKVKEMQNSETIASMKMMQQMLKQLKGSPDSFESKLRTALSKGDFGKASGLLKQMQNELKEGNLSEEQKKKLSEQMQALSKALEDLSKQNEELEKALESMGLNKELAKMSEKDLREALQKQGLNSDQIQDMMNKAAASKMAQQRMSQLASAIPGSGMQGGSGLSDGEGLSEAIEQLNGLEALQQQIMMTEMSMKQIAKAIGSLGKGMGQGLGQGQGQSPWDEGDTSRLGSGSGGPGMGSGPRDSDTEGDYDTQKDIVNRPPGEGPIIASWYIKDVQVEGETKRELSEVIQAGRDSAAEAINESEIPRRYEDAIKSYFGSIEQNFPNTDD